METKYEARFEISYYFYIFDGHENERATIIVNNTFTLIGIKLNSAYRKEDTYVSICLRDDISI